MELIDYLNYHKESSIARDIDPANDALRYISDRFELNLQQRYWLAWLYSMTYSPVTTYYIYNEFPDYENVDVPRLERWWDKNRNNLIFQTDRLRVKSNNQFIKAFISYRDMVGGSQSTYFRSLVQPTPDLTYDNVMKNTGKFYTFGRFTQFIYLEMLNVLTGLPLEPTTLKLKDAESCRNGLVYAYGLDEYDTHGKDKKLTPTQLNHLQGLFLEVKDKIQDLNIEHKNIWNIETTLCAYKKHRLGKRYVGYYIERNRLELEKMSSTITEGINWRPLWEFRKETYDKKWLKEL
jgi:hypothetical protein